MRGCDMDRELLELAAKAAGIDCEWVPTGPDSPTMLLNEPYYCTWNPIEDDGDALRLAVKLRLLWDEMELFDFHFETDSKDPYNATRRAIVRAAAEIGRSMK